MEEHDFIVSELLSELKEENVRKDKQIKALHGSIIKMCIAAILAVLIVICSCLRKSCTTSTTASVLLKVVSVQSRIKS